MKFTIELDFEDGLHVAEIPELPGVIMWDEIKDNAIRKAIVLALQVYADKIEHNEEKEEINLKAKNFSLDFALTVLEPELIEA